MVHLKQVRLSHGLRVLVHRPEKLQRVDKGESLQTLQDWGRSNITELRHYASYSFWSLTVTVNLGIEEGELYCSKLYGQTYYQGNSKVNEKSIWNLKSHKV